MARDLPAFGSITRCPKCGIEFTYAAIPTLHYCRATCILPSCPLDLDIEHLHRNCPRCGYPWAEACIPKEVPDGACR